MDQSELLALRRLPERLLHPVRRRAARARAARRGPPRLVLVVCHGNICRSPFAAALLRRLLPGAIGVGSAGFIGPDRSPPAEATAAAARRGVDLAAHRSRLLTPALVRAADLILVMDPAQRDAVCARFGRRPRDVLVLGDFDPEPIAARAVHDPVDQALEVFEESYARIERCVQALALTLARNARTP